MEESKDVTSEITLEEFDGEQETPKAESSPVEEAKAENPEAETKEEAKAEPEAKETEGKEKSEETPTEETEKPFVKAEERKEKLTKEIRDLVAEKKDYIEQRNALKAEVEKANEVYQPATEDDLLGQVNPETGEQYTRAEAKIDALNQRLQLSDYNNKVAEAQLTIGYESNRVLQDFPIFNPDSDLYDKELAEIAATTLESNLILDPNTGQVTGVNPGFNVHNYYQTLARASGISTTKGQLKGQQDTERMLANADNASSAAPPAKKVDELAALWEEPLV